MDDREKRPRPTNETTHLHDHLELVEPRDERREDGVDKDPLAVENVYRGVGHFSVNEQRHATVAHGLQHGVQRADGCDTKL